MINSCLFGSGRFVTQETVRSAPILSISSFHKMLYVKEVVTPLYIKLLYKMGHYFLDKQYEI